MTVTCQAVSLSLSLTHPEGLLPRCCSLLPCLLALPAGASSTDHALVHLLLLSTALVSPAQGSLQLQLNCLRTHTIVQSHIYSILALFYCMKLIIKVQATNLKHDKLQRSVSIAYYYSSTNTHPYGVTLYSMLADLFLCVQRGSFLQFSDSLVQLSNEGQHLGHTQAHNVYACCMH